MKIKDWKPYQKNTLQGFFTLEFQMGVSIKDCMLHEKNGEQWIAFPGMPYQDKEGTTSYRNIIYFEDKKRGEALKKAALALLREVRGESQAAQEDPFSNNVPF